MRPNKQIYIDFIVFQLNKGNNQCKDICSLFCSKFHLTERSFMKYWKLANEVHRIEREAINKVRIKEAITQEIEAVRIQIKSKIERLDIYQKEIDNCLSDLDNGYTTELTPKGALVKRPLTISERAMLRKTIKDLQSEISKIEGDYAPTKQALTDPQGNDKKLTVAGFIIENE